MAVSILFIDDDASLLRVTEFQLSEASYQVITAENGNVGLEKFKKHHPDLVLTDLNMPGLDGLQLIEKLRKVDREIPIIVITAYGSVDNAIKTTQLGANDYLTKPFSFESLKYSIKKNLRIKQLNSENVELKKQLFDRYLPENIIGQGSEIKNVLTLIEKLANSTTTVLITGESGTGKELVARAIHNKSNRKRNPFIAVNCASIPEQLIESELFGHVRGAFTGALKDSIGKFEAAKAGTIFLDEIGDLSLDLQSKLLRVLQDHEIQRVGENNNRKIDVRVLSATHQDLESKVQDGSFRQDLFYRLNVVPVFVPPLRDRKQDIPLLLNHFIQKLELNKQFIISDEGMDLMVQYEWPGNIRELENLVERFSIVYPGTKITKEHLPFPTIKKRKLEKGFSISLPENGISLEDIEKEVIIEALQRNNNNQSKAAKFLRIPRHVLLYRIKKYNIKI